MRHYDLVVGDRHLVHAHNLGQAAHVQDVGLQDVGIGEIHQVAEAPRRRLLLAGGYGAVERVHHLAQAPEVVGRQRLFEVRRAQLFQAPALLYRGGDGVAVVGVKAERHIVGQPFAAHLEYGEVLLGIAVLAVVAPIHAHLEGAKAFFVAFLHLFQHFAGRFAPAVAAAPVERDFGAMRAAKHRIDGQSGRLAHDVPATYVDCARYLRGKARRLLSHAQRQHFPYLARLTRVFAYEQRLYDGFVVSAKHVQAARAFRYAGNAFVGEDAHYQPPACAHKGLFVFADEAAKLIHFDVGNLHISPQLILDARRLACARFARLADADYMRVGRQCQSLHSGRRDAAAVAAGNEALGDALICRARLGFGARPLLPTGRRRRR